MAETSPSQQTDAPAALGAWVDAHYPAMFWLARGLAPTEHDATEVVQQAVLKALGALRAGTEVEHPRAWLLRIVRNTAINAGRRRREAPADPDAMVVESNEPSALDQLVDREVRARVGDCVAQLPAPFKAVILLRYREQMPSEEICDALDIGREALKKRHFRAIRWLRRCCGRGSES